MKFPPDSIWDRIDASMLVPETSTPAVTARRPAATEEERGQQRKRRRRHMLIADCVGIVVWIYIVTKLFVVDLDRIALEQFAPGSVGLLNYRFFLFLGLFVLVVILARRAWPWILYVAFFPLIVLLFRIPRWVYRTQSWLVALAAVNVVASIADNFKSNVVTKSLALFAILVVLVSDEPWIIVPAVLTLLVLAGMEYAKVVRSSFRGSRFVELQEKAITRFLRSQTASPTKCASLRN